jgi:hypothetical protein
MAKLSAKRRMFFEPPCQFWNEVTLASFNPNLRVLTEGDRDEHWYPDMARPTELENSAHYAELAKLALWEAERTLDPEAARSMRALADRFKRRSERSPHDSQRSN